MMLLRAWFARCPTPVRELRIDTAYAAQSSNTCKTAVLTSRGCSNRIVPHTRPSTGPNHGINTPIATCTTQPGATGRRTDYTGLARLKRPRPDQPADVASEMCPDGLPPLGEAGPANGQRAPPRRSPYKHALAAACLLLQRSVQLRAPVYRARPRIATGNVLQLNRKSHRGKRAR